MAEKTAKARYASRTAIHGSNAYDLNRVGDLPVRQPNPVKKPAQTPAAKPAARPAKRGKTQRYYGVSLFAVAGIAVVAAMMVFVMLAHVRFNEISTQTVTLQQRLEKLTEEERKLKITYEDIFDVNEVEAYATNVLGMTKPGQDQIAAVSANHQDKAVVINADADGSGAKESMVSFLASLVAYFKQTS